MRKWRATAPSNIALIKYMGKTDSHQNQPTNSSLSYTLPHLVSLVEIEESSKGYDTWELLPIRGIEALELSDKGQRRFLQHLQYIKDLFLFEGHFVVRSNNAFPSDCGLASSASSFAALTKVAYQALSDLTVSRGHRRPATENEIAEWSRKGSGSSCRSFFGPWVLWSAQGVKAVPIAYPELLHQVVVTDDRKKSVSSSDAHKMVTSSALFQNRPARAESRLQKLVHALNQQNWQQAFEITWAEFWDMHALFETSSPPFGYMNSGSLAVLNEVRSFWQRTKDGPLVTMDAGPNIHLLYRPNQLESARALETSLAENFNVISSYSWKQPEVVS